MSENQANPAVHPDDAAQLVEEAINHLRRIPQDDPEREEAFRRVMAWIEANR